MRNEWDILTYIIEAMSAATQAILPTDISVLCLIWSVGGKICGSGMVNTRVYPWQSLHWCHLSADWDRLVDMCYYLIGLKWRKCSWFSSWSRLVVPFGRVMYCYEYVYSSWPGMISFIIWSIWWAFFSTYQFKASGHMLQPAMLEQEKMVAHVSSLHSPTYSYRTPTGLPVQ